MADDAETKRFVEFVTRIDRPSDEKFKVLAQHAERLAQRVSDLEAGLARQTSVSNAALKALHAALTALPASGRPPLVDSEIFKMFVGEHIRELRTDVNAGKIDGEEAVRREVLLVALFN